MNCACPKTCSCNAQTANLAQISCDGEVDHFGDEEGKSEADETAGTITAKETKKKITKPVKVVVNGKSSEGEGSDSDSDEEGKSEADIAKRQIKKTTTKAAKKLGRQ